MYGLFVLLAVPVLGCAGSMDEPTPTMLATSTGPLTVFATPYAANPARAMEANPIANTATAAATAWKVGSKLKLALSVAGMPAKRTFGSHLHKFTCDNMKAGGHYQNNPWPTTNPMSSANDPVYANPENEAWLDFTTDDGGKATKEVTSNWLPRAGEAKSIIIHDMATAEGGKAGDKLACLPLDLP
jgi:Cu-Zn family superoxide dismutase